MKLWRPVRCASGAPSRFRARRILSSWSCAPCSDGSAWPLTADTDAGSPAARIHRLFSTVSGVSSGLSECGSKKPRTSSSSAWYSGCTRAG